MAGGLIIRLLFFDQNQEIRVFMRRAGVLILTRRVGETLMIGDDITVTVLEVKGNQVRTGVNAPRDVDVHREEIYERIKAANSQEQSNEYAAD